jgi:hypothetical protein
MSINVQEICTDAWINHKRRQKITTIAGQRVSLNKEICTKMKLNLIHTWLPIEELQS